ncbi:protein of unknown function [Thermomonospora echinospora]|uniref:DUF397 domain-containing protein n=1 Tax=Thermomonospora echinospora TaxID=1992 RepID=A0A1H6E0L9_9ACTN|nr:DUF397 domain-containing protein [Thermomonospora echinospora]SEG91158.1 protein of unknown function [Thermomonospora echinospora]
MSDSDLTNVAWRKSTHSNNGGDCVEVGGCEHTVAVRDSKNPDGPKLLLTRSQWAALVHAVKDSA